MALHHGLERASMSSVLACATPPFLPIRFPSHLLLRYPPVRNQMATSCISFRSAHATHALDCSRSTFPWRKMSAQMVRTHICIFLHAVRSVVCQLGTKA